MNIRKQVEKDNKTSNRIFLIVYMITFILTDSFCNLYMKNVESDFKGFSYFFTSQSILIRDLVGESLNLNVIIFFTIANILKDLIILCMFSFFILFIIFSIVRMFFPKESTIYKIIVDFDGKDLMDSIHYDYLIEFGDFDINDISDTDLNALALLKIREGNVFNSLKYKNSSESVQKEIKYSLRKDFFDTFKESSVCFDFCLNKLDIVDLENGKELLYNIYPNGNNKKLLTETFTVTLDSSQLNSLSEMSDQDILLFKIDLILKEKEERKVVIETINITDSKGFTSISDFKEFSKNI